MSNKRKPIDGAIPDLDTPWDNGTEAYSGAQIEAFIKTQIAEAIAGLDKKFAHVSYEDGAIKFFAKDDDPMPLAQVTLTGDSYTIALEMNRGATFYVLNSEPEAVLRLRPTTQKHSIGSQNPPEDVPEDYTFTVLVDSGRGFVDRTPEGNNTIQEGEEGTVDLKPYLTTGNNRVRISVVGQTSHQVKTVTLTAILTSLTLSCEHRWHNAWIQGSRYGIGNIYIGGNTAKTLHVKVGEHEYTQQFAASVQYTTVPYTFDLSNCFPAEGTGVYDVEVWLDGAGVVTDRYRYRIMCVAADAVTSAGLICINDVPPQAVNFTTQRIFSYATYGLTDVSLDVRAVIGDESVPIVTSQQLSVQTETVATYTTALQVDTDQSTGLELSVTLSAGAAAECAKLGLDNSNAYLATEGAAFYLNAANMANNRPDREVFPNMARGAGVDHYDADWDSFTWADDAWAYDHEGHKALAVMAGSSLEVSGYKPLGALLSGSVTIEMMCRASAVADYDTPVLTIMSTPTYDPAQTCGLILKPTSLLMLSSGERSQVSQKLDFGEDRIVHLTIVLQKDYPGVNRNLCHIYLNGRENAVFEFGGSSAFTGSDPTQNYLRIGQPSTDFYLYMLRSYNKALEPAMVHANYLNALIDTASVSKAGERNDSDILDNGAVNYELCRKKGFNTMVLEPTGDIDFVLPDVQHNEPTNVNLRLEYGNHPDWNVTIHNIPVEGQGTTSMKYYRWNLKFKGNNNTEWEYSREENGEPVRVPGPAGYIDGTNTHPMVSKITAKKNVASSPQGHKMGATGLYNDLYHRIFRNAAANGVLPTSATRVAVYQHPFIGFHKKADGTYEFIGLYTVGPDKTDKKTFGYDATATFPNLMMIEGPNHEPHLTLFLVPWTDDVCYNAAEECLYLGSGATKEEGWDADIVADLNTKTDGAAVFNLFKSEFKPAYDSIYYTSPYLASLAESGKTLDEINADVTTFRTGTTRGYDNTLMTFYDDQYRLVYYRYTTGRYEVLPLPTHNMLQYLGLEGTTPDTETLLSARTAKFLDDVDRVVNFDEAIYHEAFCELLGVSDNHAKNTYWRKFKAISAGGKWGFNQDDMDTIFQIDNNGQDSKSYSVEPGDMTPQGHSQIFQGASSAFWYHLRMAKADKIRGMMSDILDKASEMAGELHCAGGNKAESLLNVIDHYFWRDSSRYFPAMAYNADSRYAYIDVWAKAPDATYNAVKPLSQLHGDHYETERAWVERRIAYILSKYQLGGFAGSDAGGYGIFEFTPGENTVMRVTPAIDLYPTLSIGGGGVQTYPRTAAGQECEMDIPGSGTTTYYLKGLDWIEDMGDLSGMRVVSRGGSDEVTLSINGRRLRRLKVGDANADVKFSATSLDVKSAALEEIDAQRVTSLQGKMDLRQCTRLRRALLGGTSLTSVLPPVGGRVTRLQLPATLSTLFLHSLSLLPPDGLSIEGGYGNIVNLYVNSCSQLNPIALLEAILKTEGNRLKYLTLIWDGIIDVNNPGMLDAIARIADKRYNGDTTEGYGRLTYDGADVNATGDTPVLQGELRINTPAYQTSLDTIESTLQGLKLHYNRNNLYIPFADPEVLRVLLDKGIGDGYGITYAAARSGVNFATGAFKGNTALTSFDEFVEFEGATIKRELFDGCTNLTSVTFPATSTAESFDGMFKNCTLLQRVDMSHLPKIRLDSALGRDTFNGCRALTELILPAEGIHFAGGFLCAWGTFKNTHNLRSLDATKIDVTGCTCLWDTFNGCGAEYLDMSRWNTRALKAADWTFANMANLRRVDMSGWDTRSLGTHSERNSTYMWRYDKIDFITLGPAFFLAKATPIPLANGMSRLGYDEDGNDTGWLSHLAATAPAIRTLEGWDQAAWDADPLEENDSTPRLLTQEDGVWYINDGQSRQIALPSGLKTKEWAQQYLTILQTKGYTIV